MAGVLDAATVHVAETATRRDGGRDGGAAAYPLPSLPVRALRLRACTVPPAGTGIATWISEPATLPGGIWTCTVMPFGAWTCIICPAQALGGTWTVNGGAVGTSESATVEGSVTRMRDLRLPLP